MQGLRSTRFSKEIKRKGRRRWRLGGGIDAVREKRLHHHLRLGITTWTFPTAPANSSDAAAPLSLSLSSLSTSPSNYADSAAFVRCVVVPYNAFFLLSISAMLRRSRANRFLNIIPTPRGGLCFVWQTIFFQASVFAQQGFILKTTRIYNLGCRSTTMVEQIRASKISWLTIRGFFHFPIGKFNHSAAWIFDTIIYLDEDSRLLSAFHGIFDGTVIGFSNRRRRYLQNSLISFKRIIQFKDFATFIRNYRIPPLRKEK